METVLIVGAGPTGLTLAAVLARYGVIPRVIDRAVKPPEDRARAIVLQARTLELFEDIGVIREFLDTALRVDRVNLVTSKGRRGSLRIRTEWVESRFADLRTLPQEETERILTAHVESAGVQIERGVELLSIEQDATGTRALLRRADGRTETAHASWIVGCDGAHSAVRGAVGLKFPGVTYPEECMVGDVDLDWHLPDAQVSLCPSDQGLLLVFPLAGRHRFRIIMIRPAAREGPNGAVPPEEFLDALTGMVPPDPAGARVAPRLLAARWLTRYRLHRRGVTAYRVGRCFVAGDAAHIHSPAGAQGMNTGIQDAFNLGWKLALVTRAEAPASLLESYHAERHRVGQFLLSNTDRMFALLGGGGPLGQIIRRVMPALGVRLLGTRLLGRRIARVVSQTGIRYRRSPLTSEGRGADVLGADAPRAGDRVPDVALDDGSPLALLLKGAEFVVLLLPGHSARGGMDVEALRSALSEHYASLVRLVVVSPPAPADHDAPAGAHGALDVRLGARDGAMYLIRPDKYIAWRGGADDGQEVLAALDGILLSHTAVHA